MVDSNKVTAFITALANKFENKVANKKDNIDGDFSSDSVSYPTVKAVKGFFGTKITSWSGTASNSNYPSEKLVKDELDGKISKSNTAGFVKNDGTIDTTTYLSQHQDISGKANLTDLSTVATSGSYVDLSNKPEIPPLQVITEGTAITEDGIYLEIPAPPVLRLTVDTTEYEPRIFTSNEYDDTPQGLTGTNMVINWGDGTTESLASNTEFPNHEYNEAGEYNITVSGVTSIGSYCFYSCQNLINVIIPSTVTTISERAFYGCSQIESVVMSEGITTLGDSCFSGCYYLETISIPASVTSLGTDCFYDADSLNEYQLYWTGDNIPNNAYELIKANSDVIIPNGETNNYISKGFNPSYYQLQERSA